MSDMIVEEMKEYRRDNAYAFFELGRQSVGHQEIMDAAEREAVKRERAALRDQMFALHIAQIVFERIEPQVGTRITLFVDDVMLQETDNIYTEQTARLIAAGAEVENQ